MGAFTLCAIILSLILHEQDSIFRLGADLDLLHSSLLKIIIDFKSGDFIIEYLLASEPKSIAQGEPSECLGLVIEGWLEAWHWSA